MSDRDGSFPKTLRLKTSQQFSQIIRGGALRGGCEFGCQCIAERPRLQPDWNNDSEKDRQRCRSQSVETSHSRGVSHPEGWAAQRP